MTNEEHVRAQLVQIWEDLDQRGKDRFATMLGFEGKPESKRRSARRLVQGSRSISPDKQKKIRRSYAQRYGRDKVVDLEDREKVDVTEYFKPIVKQGERAWTGQSPPLAFQVPYRIRAVVVAVQEDSTIGWFATTPTVRPSTRPNPHRIFAAWAGWISKNSPSSSVLRMTSCMS